MPTVELVWYNVVYAYRKWTKFCKKNDGCS